MKKILPVAQPIITTFPGYANTLSILLSYPETFDWIFSQYIQICTIDCVDKTYGFPETEFTFFVDSDWGKNIPVWSGENLFVPKKCPFFRKFSLPSELVIEHDNKFSELVKEFINHNMYITTFLDVNHIKAYNIDNTTFSHDIFIYGYDTESDCCFFSDFLHQNGHYTTHQLALFSELNRAYDSIVEREVIQNDQIHTISLIRIDPNYSYTLDINFICDSIKKYLYPSTQDSQALLGYLRRESLIKGKKVLQVYQGVNVYDYLIDFAKNSILYKKPHIDIRLFHAMYDHKVMMLQRMKYLLEKGIVPLNKSYLIEDYEQVVKSALQARNIILKINFSRDSNLNSLNSVSKIYNYMKESEYNILYNFFKA